MVSDVICTSCMYTTVLFNYGPHLWHGRYPIDPLVHNSSKGRMYSRPKGFHMRHRNMEHGRWLWGFEIYVIAGSRHALVHPNHEGIHIMDARQATSECAGSYLACPGLQAGLPGKMFAMK